MTVDVFSRDNRNHLSTGSLLTVNNQIDQTTGTVRLKAVFDNNDSMLWPNQFVNARLLLDVKKNATVVPAAAVQRGAEGTYAFVVKADNTVEVRQVKVGVTEGNLDCRESGSQSGRERRDRWSGQATGGKPGAAFRSVTLLPMLLALLKRQGCKR